MSVIERAVVGLCRAVLWLSTSVIFVILCANTVLRYATGSSVQWANEVPELLFPWLVMAGVVLAANHGAHITTTFLIEKLPFAAQREPHAHGVRLIVRADARLKPDDLFEAVTHRCPRAVG